MDWSKAKNILIITFIITNILLGYVLFMGGSQEYTYLNIDETFIDDVRERLMKIDIKVDAEIPDKIPAMALLDVEYETYDIEDLVHQFIGDIYDGLSNDYYYTNGEAEILIIKEEGFEQAKRFIYKDLVRDDDTLKSLDEATLDKVVEDFLRDKGMAGNDYKLTSHTISPLDPQTHILKYTKVYEGILVEKSDMIFEIDEKGIKRFEREWLKTGRIKDGKLSIRSAPEALLRLLSKEEAHNKTIVSIEPCYYFSPYNLEFSDKNLRSGQATPAWRIQFKDSSILFLEEY